MPLRCVKLCVCVCVRERERAKRDKAGEVAVPLRAKNEEMKRGFGLVSAGRAEPTVCYVREWSSLHLSV